MSTKTLIDRLQPQVPDGYQRSTGNRSLLVMIQNAIDILFDWDAPFMHYLDPATGWPPYLQTEASTYEYEVTAANLSVSSLTKTINGTSYNVRAKRVLKMFLDATNIDYGKRYIGETYLRQWLNPYTTSYEKLEFADIPVDSTPVMENTPARVTLKELLGNTTNIYYLLFTWEPPRMTGEAIPLPVAEKYEEAIEDYVVGRVHKEQKGKMSERLRLFWDFWVPDFRSTIQQGANSYTTRVTPRFC